MKIELAKRMWRVHQTKIEQAEENVEELRRKLKEEVAAEVRGNLRRRAWRNFAFRCLGCCGIYLLVLLTIPAALLFLAARSGFVRVPALSERIVHERTPEHSVVPAPARLEQRFASALRELARAPESGVAAVTLSESELTGLLREALTKSQSIPALVGSTAQVVVTAEEVELFARVPGAGGATTTLRIRAVPGVTSGKIGFAIREAAIGNVRVPPALVNLVVQRFLASLPALAIPAEAGRPGFAIEQIVLGDGQATFKLRRQR